MISRGTAISFLAVSLASVAASQLLMKARFVSAELGLVDQIPTLSRTVSRILGDPLVWVCGGLLLVGAFAWYAALMRLPLSFMLPIAGVVSPIVALAAHCWLDEPLPLQKLAAICVIGVGIVWLGLQEKL